MNDGAMDDQLFELGSRETDTDVMRYRPLSITALLSLFLGCLSVTALATPLLWPLPGLAMLTGAVALRSIARSGGLAVGRRAALCGLLLGTLMLTMGVTGLVHDRAVVFREARRFTDGWFDLLAHGRWQAAHQATLPHYQRNLSALSVAHGYDNQPRLQQEWDEFKENNPLAEALQKAGPQAHTRFLSWSEQRYMKKQRVVVLQYEIEFPDRGPLVADVMVIRDDAWNDDPASWQLSGLTEYES